MSVRISLKKTQIEERSCLRVKRKEQLAQAIIPSTFSAEATTLKFIAHHPWKRPCRKRARHWRAYPITETFGANVMMYSLRERQSIPSAFSLVGQPTKIAKSDNVPDTEFAGVILVSIRSRCGLVVVKSKEESFLLDIFHQRHLDKKKPLTRL